MDQLAFDESTWAARLDYSSALFKASAELSGAKLEIACTVARAKFVDAVGADVAAKLDAAYVTGS